MKIAELTLRNKLGRALWSVVWGLLFRFSPRGMFAWRAFLLRLFGANLGSGVHVYPSAKIWAPWNLVMGQRACIADHVICYNVSMITIGDFSTVSQFSNLCTASHDYRSWDHPLMVGNITMGSQVWVTADVFIGPGVNIGDGAVVTARTTIFDDIEPWVVVSSQNVLQKRERVMRVDDDSKESDQGGCK